MQNKLRELLGGVSEQMLAEDGITIPSYMAGTDDMGASLCPQQIEKWAVAAQNRFMESMNAQAGPMTIHVEPAPAVLQPVFALVSGKLVAGQPGKVARPMDLANQEPVDLPSMPTQEHTLEVPQSPPRHQGVTASAELDAAPPAFTRPEQMGASEVSHIAFD